MTLFEILAILFIHWFSDFVCQSDKMAKGKSSNMKDLLNHTFMYSSIWINIGLVITFATGMNVAMVFPFCLITFVAHTITDYFTSRLNAKLWMAEKRWQFFVSIGFDQWLHYAQLFLTYKLLFK